MNSAQWRRFHIRWGKFVPRVTETRTAALSGGNWGGLGHVGTAHPALVLRQKRGAPSDVTVVLPFATDCDDTGTICTQDGRMLPNRNQLTVSVPG